VGGGQPSYPNALPSPETISLGAQQLLSPVETDGALRVVRTNAEAQHIDGIYLDALEPVSCVQGWGKLQRNQSVWEKPMTIGGRRFRRGLGTHADSRIVCDIGGVYRLFQSWVGADGASNATITFEVWLDGQKRWESGLMTKQSPAKLVELDVTGVRRLELVVGHGSDDNTSDHANWADATLLR
jgi:beta-galactosidase